jgi:hypothetical protein
MLDAMIDIHKHVFPGARARAGERRAGRGVVRRLA